MPSAGIPILHLLYPFCGPLYPRLWDCSSGVLFIYRVSYTNSAIIFKNWLAGIAPAVRPRAHYPPVSSGTGDASPDHSFYP